jgi:hypothetical protein
MAAVDLTTVANVKEYGAIEGAANDGLLQKLVTAASRFAESYCSRSFHSAAYTETYNGTGTYRLLLRNFPVTAVAAVSVNGAPLASSVLNTSPGFQFDELGLYAVGGLVFPRCGPRNVVVTYTAGYVEIPEDLAQAVNELVVLKFKRRTNLDIAARAIANETISYSDKDMTRATRAVFDLYRGAAPL